MVSVLEADGTTSQPVEAQLLFLHLDSDRDGLLTMLELLQIVFSKLERRDQGLYISLLGRAFTLAARRKQKDMELLIQKRTGLVGAGRRHRRRFTFGGVVHAVDGNGCFITPSQARAPY